MPQAMQRQADAPAAAATSRFMWQGDITISMRFLYRFSNSDLLILPPAPTAPAYLRLRILWENVYPRKAPPPFTPMSLICCKITTVPYAPAAEDRLTHLTASAATAENPFDRFSQQLRFFGAVFILRHLSYKPLSNDIRTIFGI